MKLLKGNGRFDLPNRYGHAVLGIPGRVCVRDSLPIVLVAPASGFEDLVLV